MPEASSGSRNITAVDPTEHLPLSLLGSEVIPAAPNRSISSIDWLPDFAGYSWVAYGASSLLVISHFNSPLSREQTLIGPIFRQVIELSADVPSVSWSQVMPSIGELAAASDNCIFVFSHDSAKSKGSFCWSQNAVLVQSTKVDAIEWTGSGDGIIAGGIELNLWKRRSRSWEIAWKFKGDQPQNMVSSTWFIEGPSATTNCWSKPHFEGSYEGSKCAFVFYSDGKSEYAKVELHHPQAISMIQWRPTMRSQSVRELEHSPRHILLTCCLDGAVRLWSETDNGKVKKVGSNHKSIKRSFCVAAVIEINHVMNGTLGGDVFLIWAMQIDGIFKTKEGAAKFFSMEGHCHEKTGKCEWLIGFGPGLLVTFWAIHCLDDISPMRFPRVTLWKRQELQSLGMEHLHSTALANSKDQLLLKKVVILRNSFSSSPTICSLIHLLPCNSLISSLLYTKASSTTEAASVHSQAQNSTMYLGGGILDMDGHTGKILQVALHPYICEVELAVSLDSNGLLLFWSFSTTSNCVSDFATLLPMWKLCGRFVMQDSCSKYTCMTWAPSVWGEERVLLMGHIGGIDCFLIKVYETGNSDVVCHYLCTIPFTDYGPCEVGPKDIFSISLQSSCNKTFKYNNFMLLGLWMEGFQALSWRIMLHSYGLSGSCCECGVESGRWKFEETFGDNRYCISVYASSSDLPEPHKHDKVTSFAVVCPNCSPFDNDTYSKNPAYVMATGQSDGSLKLWRSSSHESSTSLTLWELVGMCFVHPGPVGSISLADCGRKIATVCMESNSSSVNSISIWDIVHLTDTGIFMLEDTLAVDGDVVALKWSALEYGELILGVCMQNEFRIYAQRRCGGQMALNSNNSLKKEIWFCIAFTGTLSAINDLLLGPRGNFVVIHDGYFSLYNQWLFLVDKSHNTGCHPDFIENNPLAENGLDKNIFPDVFTNSEAIDLKKTMPYVKFNMKNDHLTSRLFVLSSQLEWRSSMMRGFWSMSDIAEKLGGSLPVYHPEALFVNIYSGNWKRAYVSLRHLVDHLTSRDASKNRDFVAKSSHIFPQIILSNYLEGHLSNKSSVKGFHWSGATDLKTSLQFQGGLSQFDNNVESHASTMLISTSTTSELSGFVEPLEKLYELAGLTSIQKTQILAIIDLLNEVIDSQSASAYANLDEPGRRFWVALRFQQLYYFRSFGRLASGGELVIDSSLMGCAFHSDSQETLFLSFLPNEPSWKEMRALGIGFWFTNVTQLRSRMEKLARLQYLKKKDAKDCALLYIALNRLQVLTGLFKISKDEKDKPLVGFLSRNFQEEKNKAAALKNAYVLMGRHQLEMAIAFFLLGGDASSAVSVCAKNLGDEQLALVICRLIEGRGGSLERNLITRFILPSAIERGDYWLASLLEWELGNYSESFFTMVGLHGSPIMEMATLSSSHAGFMDPSIGLHCLTLANKNTMKNAIGEGNAAILCRWATLMRAIALSRCGFPLEALECLSSSVSNLGATDQAGVSNSEHSFVLHGSLKPFLNNSSNWLLGNKAYIVDTPARLDLAFRYFSKLIKEHPSWPDTIVESDGDTACSKNSEIIQYGKLLENFGQKLYIALTQFEQKFSLASSSLISMILASLFSKGLLFIGNDILRGYCSPGQSTDERLTVDGFLLHPFLQKSLLKASNDISLLFSHFIIACNITCLQLKSRNAKNEVSCGAKSKESDPVAHYCQGVILSLWRLRATMRGFFSSYNVDANKKPAIIIDLYEYLIHIASAWLQRNARNLFWMLQPLLITYTNGQTPYEVDMVCLKNRLTENIDFSVHNSSIDNTSGPLQVHNCIADKDDGDLKHSIPEDERWQIIGICLWQHITKFVKHKLACMSIELDDGHLSDTSHEKLYSSVINCQNFEYNDESITELSRLLSLMLAKLLKSTLAHISFHHVKQLALLMEQKVVSGFHVPTLSWFEESRQFGTRDLNQHLNQDVVSSDIMNTKDEYSVYEVFWDIFVDPGLVTESFMQENINWSDCLNHIPSRGWDDMHKVIIREHDMDKQYKHESKLSNGSGGGEAGSPARDLFRNGHAFVSSWRKDMSITKEVTTFRSPKEIHKRNGELLEALCINSVHQWQAALSSNRKGIIFFNWENEIPFSDQSDYIWSDADWPQNGWAGSESTPVPTCVSPGVGLGSRKGAHLGLGGATIGVGSLARPGRDLTGIRALGFPGYAGIGASSLGWGIQEDFEEFVDPPATVETISTRAFSSHPSRPFFLVGSSNTHIYLWEFGKDRATATYGVLPAANVPPPYALASISALQFDHYGHRFATAALDGTVCAWQLEVGGRSNIRPTESSLCFNSHASDLTYITSSGSVIAAAGYSSNGVNVVIWDTLAPPTTSRASISCHEGGARSISVFDNDFGSGSISPLIVTGGKGGDIGLHDFRYIATGRTKRHRHFDNGEPSITSSSNSDMQTEIGHKFGEQNSNGMLWYLPKAHLGSVTKISTIPNTSLFLTGSKDGDVKLWDAKAAKLVHHWPKLHERHTFLQPSSRGYGGIVRAAVTDIQVYSHGFLTCGGDGCVKLVQLKDCHLET